LKDSIMTLTADANGVFPIAPTAFNPDGTLDWASTEKLFSFYDEIGSDGTTVLGIMGEAPKLEPEESLRIVKTAVAGMPGKPVIVGVSAPGFAAMRSLARQSMELGAAAVMIAPPPSLRTDDQITGYYAQAVEAIGTDIPCASFKETAHCARSRSSPAMAGSSSISRWSAAPMAR
jgi:4-hydroxy-tetrahydrodipicolinate synthase